MSFLGTVTPKFLKRQVRLATMTRERRRNRAYDLDTMRVLSRVSASATCIDIGAADGKILSRIVMAAPHGRHYAFEPRPDAAERLEANFPGVMVHHMALGDRSGEASFQHVSTFPGRSGLRRQDYPGDAEVREISVPIERLDNVVDPADPVEFIKIDVEGAEHMVLQGGAETCLRCEPIIVFEYGTAGRNHYQVSPAMMYGLVGDLGLRLYHLADWLRGRPPLSLAEFEQAARSHWYFLAHK